jgi:hypothetical protein
MIPESFDASLFLELLFSGGTLEEQLLQLKELDKKVT